MCGIIGSAGQRQPPRDLFLRQCSALLHRGPDGSGEWRSGDGRVALGHRRLAIIDLSEGGAQPMGDASGRHHVVLNGEIYNYRELRTELASRGHGFRSASDTEVLLAAYSEWGIDCLTRLNGMFAFGLFDSARNTLVLARDRAGEKPLFYCHANGRLLFASELKALLSDTSIPRVINPEALDHYLAYGFVPGNLCILQGIQKLPPGHVLEYHLGSDSSQIRRYWSLPSPAFDADPRLDADELVDELHALLADAVRLQLVADVPVGILLSGGVDSSLVTALAASVSSDPVRTYTIAFPGHGSYNEGPYARLVAEHFGTQHTELVAEPATVDLLPRLARQYDEPIGDSSMVPTYLVAQLVRQSCTVALGGDAGDELFGGYMHHSRVQSQQRWRRLMPHSLKAAVGGAARALPTGVRGRTYLRSLTLPDADAWAGATLHLDRAARRRLSPATSMVLGDPPQAHRLAAGKPGQTLLQRVTAADFSTYLPEDILVKVDRASMLTSLEMRAPFLDYRVIEFAFGRVPDRLRATATERKILLKMLARRLLPPQLDINRKQGFSIPMDAWFKGQWGDYLSSVLREAPATLYAPRVVDELLKGQQRGLPNGQRLFNLAIFELWRLEYGASVG